MLLEIRLTAGERELQDLRERVVRALYNVSEGGVDVPSMLKE